MYTEYEYLTSEEKGYYQTLLRSLSAYRTLVRFGAVSTGSVERAFRAVMHDQPQIFWLSGAGTFTATKVNGVLRDVEFEVELQPGLRIDRVPTMARTLETAVNRIVSGARQKRTAYEQVMYVHDCIVDTTEYDLRHPMCYNAYGCLVDHRAVCAGYSKAFMMIMNKLGFVCGYAAGWGVESGVTHAWNYIQLDGEWYFIDTTWDDPTTTGGTPTRDNKTHHYFCLTTEELSRTHRLSTEFHVPRCGGTRYNYYNFYHCYLPRYRFDEVSRMAQTQLRRGNRFTVKFQTTAEADRAYADLILANKVYTIPGVGRQILYSRSKSRLILDVENR